MPRAIIHLDLDAFYYLNFAQIDGNTLRGEQYPEGGN